MFRLSESLKSKILLTMVPTPGYTRFITNLQFRATQRLERMRFLLSVLYPMKISAITPE